MADVACGSTPCDLATGRLDDLGQVGGSASRQVDKSNRRTTRAGHGASASLNGLAVVG